jgi:predicted esterase
MGAVSNICDFASGWILRELLPITTYPAPMLVFFIHGKEDMIIPFAQRQRLAEAGRAEKIKE